MKSKFVALIALFLILFSITAEAAGLNKKITFYGELGYPPFTYAKEGFLTGFDNDLSNMIFNNNEYEIRYSILPWDKAYNGVKNGEADTCGLLAINEERKEDLIFSETILNFYISIYTKNDFKKISVNNLSELKIGLGKAQYSEYIIEKNLGLYNYNTYETLSDALAALENGEIDVLFENQEVINYLIIHNSLNDRIVAQQSFLFPTQVAYGVRKSNPELVRYINNRFKKLVKSGVYEEIYQKYFFTHSEIYKNQMKRKIIIFAIIILFAITISYIILRMYIRFLKNKLIKEYKFSNIILTNSDLFVIGIKGDGAIVKFNKFAEKVTGCNCERILGENYKKRCKECGKCKEIFEFYEYVKNQSNINNKEISIADEKGKFITLTFKGRIINDIEEANDTVVLIGMDISERLCFEQKLQESYEELNATYEELAASEEELRAQYDEIALHEEKLRISEERFRMAMEGANDIIWDIELKNNEIYFSDRWYEVLGYDKVEIKQEDIWTDLVHAEDRELISALMKKHFQGITPLYSCEHRLKTKSGQYKWFFSRGKAHFDNNGKAVRFSGSITDINEKKEFQIVLQNNHKELVATYNELYDIQVEQKKQYEELRAYKDQLKYLADHDHLTGLLNRKQLYENFILDLHMYPNENKALIFIDLDNFKYINDTLGHYSGDMLIVNMARRLSGIFKEEWQKVHRFGGDEFVVYINKYSKAEDIKIVAEEIIRCFKEPIDLINSVVNVTVSIGIALYPNNGENINELVKSADIALYRAKAAGKNRYVFFDEYMNEAVVERMLIENNLRNALENDEFSLLYQPQVNIKTNKIAGFEALIRWNNKELGFVSPLKFIKIAEDTRLIIPIGKWILMTACKFIKSFHDKGYKELTIAVNISVIQLLQDNFTDMVKEIINDIGLNPKCLEIEITESVLIESYETICEILAELKAMGIKIALDDFGQGYSSLSYLKQLPITTLKIDKVFIDSIADKNPEASLAESIITIGHKMGLKVLAEGVEAKEQLDYLRRYKCDIIQGYIFSKPLNKEDAVTFFYNTIHE